ncbi:putative transcriptional regulator, AsnC family [Haloterrigena turkmenica DSM 5511]|uniref:Transcriptional regulator, AsnC family n=1 Tax=Haloterrigena turkmenica (strain ATCC 51198 / DSM 5511 / JCM 9101 / NCIMB 13204 / VKM B-1734 / 4k) TaxID=543526 RepID=D2RZ54_HALTV|nr:AsnC family transcriptional regulator [Haloterrigena turkmenica]ADB59978.1 putative transcriptional regulator, AsnC family [Haloterrigena turkmenica DSM 5511]
MVDLDRDDLAILHVLQDDARNATTEAIGAEVGLAASTVASRINDLEDRGVVTGYRPEIDYEKAGFEQRTLLVGTVTDEADDEAIVADVSEVENVVSVRRLLADEADLHVELVTDTQERVEAATDELHELGIEIVQTNVIVEEDTRAFDHLGKKYTTDG